VLSDLRKNGQLCDAVIRVEDGHFTVHRAIMSACSPYFRALFTNGMHETDKREVSRHTNRSVLVLMMKCAKLVSYVLIKRYT